MKHKNQIFSSLLVGLLVVATAGCGKQSPTSPTFSQKNNDSTSKVKELKPTDIAYSGVFTGTKLTKPWYWFDANDNAAFNAQIRVGENGHSSNITRVNEGTWGKVHTFPITCASNYHFIRIFVPSHSSSVTWKLVIQEEEGAWRNWVLQESTGETGYKDYDFATILNAVNAGSGKFTINILVEGAVGESIEVAELYVFAPVDIANANNAYWEQTFPYNPDNPPAQGHTPGWFDETTNVGFNATIRTQAYRWGILSLPSDKEWGKVLSPVITCDTSVYKILRLRSSVSFQDDYTAHTYRIGIQEQGGAYRHWWVNVQTPFPTPSYGFGVYQWDISSLGLPADMPFSVEINLNNIGTTTTSNLYVQSIGLYKE